MKFSYFLSEFPLKQLVPDTFCTVNMDACEVNASIFHITTFQILGNHD